MHCTGGARGRGRQVLLQRITSEARGAPDMRWRPCHAQRTALQGAAAGQPLGAINQAGRTVDTAWPQPVANAQRNVVLPASQQCNTGGLYNGSTLQQKYHGSTICSTSRSTIPADVQDLVPVCVGKVLAVVQQAQLQAGREGKWGSLGQRGTVPRGGAHIMAPPGSRHAPYRADTARDTQRHTAAHSDAQRRTQAGMLF